jgi:hypothetical protein
MMTRLRHRLHQLRHRRQRLTRLWTKKPGRPASELARASDDVRPKRRMTVPDGEPVQRRGPITDMSCTPESDM